MKDSLPVDHYPNAETNAPWDPRPLLSAAAWRVFAARATLHTGYTDQTTLAEFPADGTLSWYSTVEYLGGDPWTTQHWINCSPACTQYPAAFGYQPRWAPSHRDDCVDDARGRAA